MIKKKFILIFFTSIFLFSCSQKSNILDTDLSNLPKPKKPKLTEDNTDELIHQENKKFIKKLDSFQSKDKLLSQFKIGKNNPFSKDENRINQLLSDFKLTGFLNTETQKYVFVSYLGSEGTISEDSVGGLNTNLLPNGAKVITIDSKGRKLKISLDNEEFIFEL